MLLCSAFRQPANGAHKTALGEKPMPDFDHKLANTIGITDWWTSTATISRSVRVVIKVRRGDFS